MSLNINAAMPWFIISFSLLTTLALYGSYSVKLRSLLITIFM